MSEKLNVWKNVHEFQNILLFGNHFQTFNFSLKLVS